MSSNFKGGCNSLLIFLGEDPTKYNCCSSWHEDEDLGYFDLMDFSIGDDWYSVCCSIYNALEEKGFKEK